MCSIMHCCLLLQGEKSERVLQLTSDMIAGNSADYTTWQYRWEVLQELHADLTQEYDFTRRIADESAKNYQLWNHRRKLAKALGPDTAQAELQFCKDALDADAKNYHAWAHRQVVVSAAGHWQQEMEYVQQLLQEDVRNNSAWNQRFFVLQHTLDQYHSLAELLDAELNYTAAQIARVPDNESAWNYLWGLFTLPGCKQNDMARQERMYVICQEALADSPSCKPALDTLAHYYYSLALTAAEQHASAQAAVAARYGLAVLARAAIADPVKDNYWRYREQQLHQLLAKAEQVGKGSA
eukprot:GHRR01006649.1.p1 GENE.GHRR01006649.1~~GHRR01006649.1.p1  ORF type:complete len:296 (+),score=116.88 GHRR01006649.1:1024-1911(+)